jgi:two-component system sensor histidine kinase RegB
VLLGVPVMIASTILRPAWVIALGLLAVAATLAMAEWKSPLPWRVADRFDPPTLYAAGLWTALVSGAGFMSLFAWRLAADARAMSTALAATEMVLAREQRLSALGGLAAAAAHELGTPLATIQIVANEMARAAPEGSEGAEDARLLVQQAERCRDILRQLGRRGDEGDEIHARITLGALLEEVGDPLKGVGPELEIRLEPVDGAAPSPPPLRRSPEMLYAVGNLLDNAIDHAATLVAATGRWSPDWVEIEIADDGPGFQPAILAKLGEPYVTSRGAESGKGGLGLGFFIAKLFVERTGGTLQYGNRRAPLTGAVVRARWPIAKVREEGAS